MERIAAFVEGHTEYHFIKAAYYNVIPERPFPNGKNVSLSLIVQCLKDSLDTLGGSVKKVVVLLDREGRPESAAEMRTKIADAIGILPGGREIYIGVTDRHIENWILSDAPLIQSRFGQSSYTYAGDGTYGKPDLQKLAGHAYSNPIAKSKLLLASSPTRSAAVSPSLASFRASIDFAWPWMQS